MEFVISNAIRVHPMALVQFEQLRDEEAREQIERLAAGYADKPEFFVDQLSRGLARIAAVLVREFAKRFDGFSIGSNDLTQLTLGVDRDSGLGSELEPAHREQMMTGVLELLVRSGRILRIGEVFKDQSDAVPSGSPV